MGPYGQRQQRQAYGGSRQGGYQPQGGQAYGGPRQGYGGQQPQSYAAESQPQRASSGGGFLGGRGGQRQQNQWRSLPSFYRGPGGYQSQSQGGYPPQGQRRYQPWSQPQMGAQSEWGRAMAPQDYTSQAAQDRSAYDPGAYDPNLHGLIPGGIVSNSRIISFGRGWRLLWSSPWRLLPPGLRAISPPTPRAPG